MKTLSELFKGIDQFQMYTILLFSLLIALLGWRMWGESQFQSELDYLLDSNGSFTTQTACTDSTDCPNGVCYSLQSSYPFMQLAGSDTGMFCNNSGEICDDGTDNDGDGHSDCGDPECHTHFSCDQDFDGVPVSLCSDNLCYGGDCNDNNGSINQYADEICGDDIDNDCDGKKDEEDPEGCETLGGYDCPAISANVGDACDDGDVCTINDAVNDSCNCEGVFQDADNDNVCDANDLCPGSPEPGTACNDGDVNSTNDTINGQCICEGVTNNGVCLEGYTSDEQFVCWSNCQGGSCSNDGDTEDPTFTCANCPGSPTYDCPALQANVGDSCNDGNANTTNDEINTQCVCEGNQSGEICLEGYISDEQFECWSNCWGGFCSTERDGQEPIYTCENCQGGPTYECPSLQANIGDSCNDNEVCTTNDKVNENCVCEGNFEDIDGDGICDALDTCNEGTICFDDNDCGNGYCHGENGQGGFDPGECVCYDTMSCTTNVGSNQVLWGNLIQVSCSGDFVTYSVGVYLNGNLIYDTAQDGDFVTNGGSLTILADQNNHDDITVFTVACIGTNPGSGNMCDSTLVTATDGTSPYNCPLLQANIGDSCDDGNTNTINDEINTDCECEGDQLTGTYDCPSLQANIGDSCNDGNTNTTNDEINADCECEGETGSGGSGYDCPLLQADIGDSCDDGNTNTINDEINADCECEGDQLGGTYDCPVLELNIGDDCSDGNTNTINDEINADCICVGQDIGGGNPSLCPDEGPSVYQGDRNIYYEIPSGGRLGNDIRDGSDYLIVNRSEHWCGQCDRTKQLNNNTQFQETIINGNCDFVSLTEGYSDWMNEIGGPSTFLGQHTRGIHDGSADNVFTQLRGAPNDAYVPHYAIYTRQGVEVFNSTSYDSFMAAYPNYCNICTGSGGDQEICDNAGVDDDGDGLADCADPECANDPVCTLANNFNIVSETGQVRTLKNYMGSNKYMALSMGETQCGPCITAAIKQNKDTAFQQYMSNGTCTFLEVFHPTVFNGIFSTWFNNIGEGDTATGRSSFVGQRSYEAQNRNEIADAFQIIGSPSKLFLDENLNVITRDWDGLDFNQYCGDGGGIGLDCPEINKNYGDSCDDGNDETINDSINTACQCVGVAKDCPQNHPDHWMIGNLCTASNGTVGYVLPDCSCSAGDFGGISGGTTGGGDNGGSSGSSSGGSSGGSTDTGSDTGGSSGGSNGGTTNGGTSGGGGGGDNYCPDLGPGTMGGKDFTYNIPSGKTITSDMRSSSEYMIVSLSTNTCEFCIPTAKELNADTAFQQQIESGNCDYSSVWNIGEGPLEEIGRDSFVGERYRQVNSVQDVRRELGGEGSTLTYYMILDRDGTMIFNGTSMFGKDQNGNGVPGFRSAFDEVCKVCPAPPTNGGSSTGGGTVGGGAGHFQREGGNWSTCNVSCGGGSQFRTVDCIQIEDTGKRTKVDDAFCPLANKPPTNQLCNTQPCDSDNCTAIPVSFDLIGASCQISDPEISSELRSVCTSQNKTYAGESVELTCIGGNGGSSNGSTNASSPVAPNPGPNASDLERKCSNYCVNHTCCYDLCIQKNGLVQIGGSNDPCESFCPAGDTSCFSQCRYCGRDDGGGSQSQVSVTGQVTCCEQGGGTSSGSSGGSNGGGSNFSWDISQRSTCSESCGGGTQNRQVVCINAVGVPVGDSLCTTSIGSKPSTTQTCNTQECGGGERCSNTCTGKGGLPAYASWDSDTASSCQACRWSCNAGYVESAGSCVSLGIYTRELGTYSECTRECGGGTRTARYVCMNSTNQIVDNSKCSGTKPADIVASCNTQSCQTCTTGQSRSCGSAVGACQPGVQRCQNGVWGAECEGLVGPSAEVCDNVDNNCNGLIDEGCSGSGGGQRGGGGGPSRGGNNFCGDGRLRLEVGEECDDGNYLDGDGCDRNCRLEDYTLPLPILDPTPVQTIKDELTRALKKLRLSCRYHDVEYHDIRFRDVRWSDIGDPADVLRTYCIVKGYDKTNRDRFHKDAATGMAEFIKVLTKIYAMHHDIQFDEYSTYNGETPFFDVSNRKRYAPYIGYAARQGLLDDVGGGLGLVRILKPAAPIQKKDASKMLENVGIQEDYTYLMGFGRYLKRKDMAEIMVSAFGETFADWRYLFGNNIDVYAELIRQLNGKNNDEQVEFIKGFILELDKMDRDVMGENYLMHVDGAIEFLGRVLRGDFEIEDDEIKSEDQLSNEYNFLRDILDL